MSNPKNAAAVTRQLQTVFGLSIVLLLISSGASYYANRQLIESAQLVNHTQEVITRTQEMMAIVRDAESAQRGYMLTGDGTFLSGYRGAHERSLAALEEVKKLTSDNQEQLRNLSALKVLVEERFAQMEGVLNRVNGLDNSERTAEFVNDPGQFAPGRRTMQDLQSAVDRIKTEEEGLMRDRDARLSTFIRWTPVLVVVAALLSILISVLSFFRIKADLDARAEKAEEDQRTLEETKARIASLEGITGRIASGDYSARSEDSRSDDLGRVSAALNAMGEALNKNFKSLEERAWLKEGEVQLAEALRAERTLRGVADTLTAAVARYVDAPVGTLYAGDATTGLQLQGAYATADAPRELAPGEGMLGQAMMDARVKVSRGLPPDYLTVASSVGSTAPVCSVIVPLVYGGSSIGAVELGMLHEPSAQEIQFLEDNREAMAIAINAAIIYERTQALLEETQAQAEELQAQHAELESVNVELEAQAQKLQASEEELRVQQEELQQTNTELEERSRLLEERNQTILERTDEIQRQAEELAQSAKYKSEFMANMSHELRTPLNSILLLSRLLAENHDATLSDEAVEYARIIQTSGNGLLSLIDEILDLSKIEAGKMSLEDEEVLLSEVASDMEALFRPVADEKGVALHITLDEDALPDALTTDKMRLEQVLKNLLSNALKFTREGSVSLAVSRVDEDHLSFAVSDTGIGIPDDKQALIFEAFQQADGSTRRKYGGTGLGLSISRELARLLGGSISLVSRVNKGSTFALTVPIIRPAESEQVSGRASGQGDAEKLLNNLQQSPTISNAPTLQPFLSTAIPESIPDDRHSIAAGDKVVLIVEDDVAFARSLLDFTRKRGYKGVVAVRGDEGVELARALKPIGILLDIELPVKNGWQVMEELKSNPATRAIPVHIMSSHQVKRESLRKGAVDFINKPFAFEGMQDAFAKIENVLAGGARKVLIVEDNPKHASALAYFLSTADIETGIKTSVADSIEALKADTTCVILDMGIPDPAGYATLEEIKNAPGLEALPIIVFTGKSLSLAEESRIRRYADSIVVKTAHSYQRILDEVSLFLHLVEGKGAGAASTKSVASLRDVLDGKNVLVVDDDVRNIYSLTKTLEALNIRILSAVDGKDALEQLRAHPETDAVLLDMMMPQMDGYETATRIRQNRDWRELPVIAVTAKAMSGDREKCIRAGASDYITKPIDLDQLVSLLRVWLHDSGAKDSVAKSSSPKNDG